MRWILFIVFIYGNNIDVHKVATFDKESQCLAQIVKAVQEHVTFTARAGIEISDAFCIPEW